MPKTLKDVASQIFWINAERIRMKQPVTYYQQHITDEALWQMMVDWTIKTKKSTGSLEHLIKAMDAKNDIICLDIIASIIPADDLFPNKDILEFPNPKDRNNFFLANRSLLILLDKYVQNE